MNFTLSIHGMNTIIGYKIMLFGPPSEHYAVACVCYTSTGTLPSTANLGDIHAYATLTLPETCSTLQAQLPSRIFQLGSKLKFTGNEFVDDGKIEGFDYAILNASVNKEITTGLAQAVSLNGADPVIVPINQRRLGKNMTANFRTPEAYWIGAGKFADPQAVVPGLVLPTSAIQATVRAKAEDFICAPTLTPFTMVDVTRGSGATATFSDESNSFEVDYGT